MWALWRVFEFTVVKVLYSYWFAVESSLKLPNIYSGVTGGGGGSRGAECPPETSDREIFVDVSGKKEARKKGKRGKNWEEKKENCKGRWKIGNGSRKSYKKKELRTLLFCFVFLFVCLFVCFFFCFSLLKTTEICFGSTKMGILYREKAFYGGEKIRKKWLCPLRKICLLCPWTFMCCAVLNSPWSRTESSSRQTANLFLFIFIFFSDILGIFCLFVCFFVCLTWICWWTCYYPNLSLLGMLTVNS